MEITSRSNSKIKYIRSLHQKKRRDQHSEFLIEGHKPVQEALKAGVNCTLVFCTDPHTLPFALPPQAQIYTVDSDLMAYMSTLGSPPDVLVAASYMPPKQASGQGLHVAVEDIQDPGNFGALLRVCHAMGVAQVWAIGQHVDLYHPRVIRGSMGAVFSLPVFSSPDIEPLRHLQQQGWQLVSTLLSQDAESSFEFQFRPQTCLLLGNEGHGLSKELSALADRALKIPMKHGFESLNITTTAAMLLHEYARQYAHDH